MNNENNFLITYGLHNYVSYVRDGEKRVFTICREEGQKMTRHAASLIAGRYGTNTKIFVA